MTKQMMEHSHVVDKLQYEIQAGMLKHWWCKLNRNGDIIYPHYHLQSKTLLKSDTQAIY